MSTDAPNYDDLFEPAGETYAPPEGPYVIVLAEFEKTSVRNDQGVAEARLRWYFEVFEQEADANGEGVQHLRTDKGHEGEPFVLAELTSTKTGIGPEGPGKSRSWLSKLNGVDDYAPGEQRIDREALTMLAENAVGGAMNVWLRPSDRGFAKIINPMPFSGYGPDNAAPPPPEFLAAQRATRARAQAAAAAEAADEGEGDEQPAAKPRRPRSPARAAARARRS